jgi:hypothetical protein
MTLNTDFIKTTTKSIIFLAVTVIILKFIQYIQESEEKVQDIQELKITREEIHNDARP